MVGIWLVHDSPTVILYLVLSIMMIGGVTNRTMCSYRGVTQIARSTCKLF